MYFKYIVIRREYKKMEYRTPLIPRDCKKLINNIIYVEKDNNRCYSDEEYSTNGCIMIDTYLDLDNKDVLVIGLKELELLNDNFKYNHMYFSHTFKNQSNSNLILSKFKQFGGSIYDLEYFTDSKERLFAFGFHAGIVGCYLGLLQFYYKKQLKNITISPFDSYDKLYAHIYSEYHTIYIQPTIAIIGNGRCTRGVTYLLNRLNLPYTIYTRSMKKDNLFYDIIINCILLDSQEPFITFDTLKLYKDPLIIVDISCDYTSHNNPIPIYTSPSTLSDPVIKINNNVDLIAIENLPTILARDSSNMFSSKLVEIINTNKPIWDATRALYLDKIKYI
jgi:saccharopine dehydrogenase (NAD+, L-lysine-forming)